MLPLVPRSQPDPKPRGWKEEGWFLDRRPKRGRAQSRTHAQSRRPKPQTDFPATTLQIKSSVLRGKRG